MTRTAAVVNRREEMKRFVAAVDVGTTSIRCHVYDDVANVIGRAFQRSELLYPKPRWIEIDPETLWNKFVCVIRDALKNANIDVSQLSCLGISTLRATFITWDKESGKPFHNFIAWNDLRADQLVKSWNSSFSMKSIRCGARLMYSLTRRNRYLAASVVTLTNAQVIMRLVWALNNIESLRSRAKEGKALFGTVDTWLLWKLTGGKVHATEYSCASSTALYDPFLLEWGTWAFRLFSIPLSMMPEVKDTSGHFGVCCDEIFGFPLPIMALAGDQQAALFGQCCFNVGDVKCTMGTGSFLDINTGNQPHASVSGLYPLVGWKIGDEVVYVAEGASNDTGTAVNWMQSVGLLENPSDSSNVALSVTDSGGLYFVPGFSGLQAPINDDKACAGVIGLKPSTSRAQITRAVLESLAYRIKQLFHIAESEVDFQLNQIRADGGVASNDFVLQLIADLTGKSIDRPENTDMACLGVAFLAGLANGVWSSKAQLKSMRKSEVVFKPRVLTDVQLKSYSDWSKAVRRFLGWYA